MDTGSREGQKAEKGQMDGGDYCEKKFAFIVQMLRCMHLKLTTFSSFTSSD